MADGQRHLSFNISETKYGTIHLFIIYIYIYIFIYIYILCDYSPKATWVTWPIWKYIIEEIINIHDT